MKNYNDWPRKKFKVKNLKLDQKNLRFAGVDLHLEQPDIIEYLVEKEDVDDIAKRIVKKGYLPNENPIVYYEGKDIVVLEGNRRITACKLLLTPKAAPRNKQIFYENLSKKLTDRSIVEDVWTYVAPSRLEANELLESRHVGGSSKRPWGPTNQDVFYYEELVSGKSLSEIAEIYDKTEGDLRSRIQRYGFYLEVRALEIDSDINQIVRQGGKRLSFTNFERFYNIKEGRELIGFEFDSEGKVTKLVPDDEFQKRLKKLTIDLINKELDSRSINKDQEEFKDYIKKFKASDSYDNSFDTGSDSEGESLNSSDNISQSPVNTELNEEESKPTSKSNPKPETTGHKSTEPKMDEGVVTSSTSIPDPTPKPPTPKPPKKKSTTYLIPGNLRCNTGFSRIDDIFYELQTLILEEHINAVSVLFRSFLDMLCYQYLTAEDHIRILKGEHYQKENDRKDLLLDSIIDVLLEKGIEESEIDRSELRTRFKFGNNSTSNDFIPSLKFMLDHIAENADELELNEKYKRALRDYLKTNKNNKDTIIHGDMNGFVHSEYYHPDDKALINLWKNLSPLILHMISKVRAQ